MLALACLLALPQTAAAFSVLAHQAVIDETWDDTLVPALRQRFGDAGKKELEEARSFAYGGSHLPDLGYFPFGNVFFTDLLHYVRSGEFIATLLAEAQSREEYAFALGVLSHYVTDNTAHPLATNRSVPEIYDELREKHGDRVTYSDDPSSHVQTEFRFDVLQVSRKQQPPSFYEHALSFQVAKPVLARAFQRTYGLRLEEVFVDVDVAILTYRWAFRELIQAATRIAFELYVAESDPTADPKDFVYEMSRGDFEQAFGADYQRPNVFRRFIGLFVKLVPDYGPFQRLIYKPLPPAAQNYFDQAMRQTVHRYRTAVAQARSKSVELGDRILDTGEPVQPGAYRPADESYAELARKLAEGGYSDVDAKLAAAIVDFLGDGRALSAIEDEGDRRETEAAVAELRRRTER
ncbi:MAG TPA: zinc dependent phospholipase C family protein [Terriglobales bacterium]|nr:zinc dependent phospholipase C family protein [Terriglobales bacterium]